ncbi:energy transducer TonB, partial [Amnimonas aquatica]|uniref:energy transducer TonB n=1 Tax=Amnimonas aquatica TaxID=2094561 RepID=UPI0011B0DE71
RLSVMSVQILRVAPPIEAPPKLKPEPPKPKPEPKPIEKPQVKRVVTPEPAPAPIPEKRPDPEPDPKPDPVKPDPAPAPEPAPPPPVVPPRFDADYLNNPAPRYPPISRRLNEAGKVLLKVQVGPDGRARQVVLHRTSGYSRLDDAAREAVAEWRFVPAKRGNEALTEWVIVPISFNLTR